MSSMISGTPDDSERRAGNQLIRSTRYRPALLHKATGHALRLGAAVGGALSLVLLARWTTSFHWDPAVAAIAGRPAAPDFGVFLGAGYDVLHGTNPYRDVRFVGEDFGYVYPPLLACLVSPLSLAATTVAVTAWSLLLVGCVLAALALVGVKDWRCYAIACLCPFTREAIAYGAIGPILTMLVAGAWRTRDRPWWSATTSGVAIAAKLFLWPLFVWFLATSRFRAGVLTILTTLGFIFLPWAAIGFAGLTQYPDLLRKVNSQAGDSYSLTALFEASGAPGAAAMALSFALGIGLLALAIRTARDTRRPIANRDRVSLSLVIAASLSLTPVVWSHYFVLLLIPVALASPRLSGLWLAVLATVVLDAFDWYRASPDGDVLPVAVLVGVVAAIIYSSMRVQAKQRPSARSDDPR